MDREHTPQKQRQKRNSSTRGPRFTRSSNNNSSTSHGTVLRGSAKSSSSPVHTCQSSQWSRSRNASSFPASIMSKTLMCPLVEASPGSTGVLYEPDARHANQRSRHNLVAPQNEDNHSQNDTRLTGSSIKSVASVERCNTKPNSSALKQSIRRPYTLSTLDQVQITPPSTSVKLITPQMQFATDLVAKLGPCLELTNFTVVGVLGLEGVGKSTVLSLLAQKEKTDDTMFVPRSVESTVLGCHETTGIDLAISMVGGSGHPTILLDSQPLLSSSILAEVLERNESQQFGALTPEQQVESVSYQIAVFMCAICHYVLIIHDGLAFQVSINNLLRKIDQKISQCRLPNVSGNSQKHAARLLYVANNVADSELLYREDELFAAHECALQATWSQALLRVPYKLARWNGYVRDDASILHTASFVLPHYQKQPTRYELKLAAPSVAASPASGSKEGESQNKRNTHRVVADMFADFDDAAEDFQRFVMSLPSSPSFTSEVVSDAVIAPGSKPLPRPHPLSLREWLNNASRVFEGVRKASCFTARCISSRDHS